MEHRRYNPALVAACALAGIIVGAYVFSPPKAPPEQQQAEHERGAGNFNQALSEGVVPPPAADLHAGDKERQAKKDAEESAALAAYESTACATWWLVAGTFGLVIVGYYIGRNQIDLMRGSLDAATTAANAARDSVRAADDAVRLAERPWIVPTGEAFVGYLNDSGSPRDDGFPYCVFLKNTGKTPALGVEIVVASGSFIAGEFPFPEYADGVIPWPVGAIGPGVVHAQWATRASFEAATYEGLERGSTVFTVWGEVKYRDSFSVPHATKFCLVRVGPKGPFCAIGPYNDCT